MPEEDQSPNRDDETRPAPIEATFKIRKRPRTKKRRRTSPSPNLTSHQQTDPQSTQVLQSSITTKSKSTKRRQSRWDVPSNDPIDSPSLNTNSTNQISTPNNQNTPLTALPSSQFTKQPTQYQRYKSESNSEKKSSYGSSRSTIVSDRFQDTLQNDEDYKAYQREQERSEQQWYLGEEADNSLTAVYDEATIVERQSKRLSAKATERHADASRWEERQLGFGLYTKNERRAFNTNISDDAGPRVALLVRELTPQFINDDKDAQTQIKSSIIGNENSVVRQDIVLPVKDPTCDMAVIARKGSQTVDHYRESRERGKPRARYWELGSNAGAKEKEAAEREAEMQAREEVTNDEDNWKELRKFSTVLQKQKDIKTQKKNATVSEEPVPTIQSIEEVRRSLPVYSVKKQLMKVIRENQICIIVGETGSGKTTQLTQYLEEEGFARFGMIGCTQPRRVAAVSVAQRVSEEFRGGCELGKEVGYAIRFEDMTGKSTLIKYMTDGILLRESIIDPDLDNYSVVIMDEAHERSLNTDVLFGILRGVVARRRDLKVIITSATLNAERFASFFADAPIFRIPGRTHPVDSFFSKTPIEDYVDGAVWQAMQLHVQAPLPGDILIFMTGQEDIETTCEVLAEKISKLDNPRAIMILPIYSQLSADLQAKIFEPAPQGTRKVVVATNIAETSITIDGIRYVIDAGYCKLKTYNPRLGMDALLLCPTSQSSANQRSGRAGRTGPGKCYRLYTASSYVNDLLDTTVPEIQRTNLSHVVLLLKTLGVNHISDFPFLDPPPHDNILKSTLGLWLLGAIDTHGNLTTLGKRMSSFPLDPSLSMLLFVGEKHRCLMEVLTIVAMLSVPNVFVRPAGREEESDAAREKFFVPESDHLTLLHVYQRWHIGKCRADWCAKHYISSKSMRKAREVREQLLDIVKSEGMKESSSDDWESIRKCIAQAFFYQASRRKGVSEYINIRSSVVCGVHPTSAVYGSGLSPDYVVYHELIMTKKEFMSCVTAVEPQWLAEAGSKLYILKEAADDDLVMTKLKQQGRRRIHEATR